MDKPGQFAVHYMGCPKCGSVYWRFDITLQQLEELAADMRKAVIVGV